MGFRDYIALMRPFNGLMASIAIAVGFFVAGGGSLTAYVAFAMASGFAIMGGGMALNDFFDCEIDKKSKKWRPIPSGRVSKEHAFFFSFALFASGVALAFLINSTAAYIAVVAAVLLIMYASHLSKIVFIGNLVVALSTALTFIFGEAAATGTAFSGGLLVLFALSFFSTLARELYMDIRDMEDDRKTRKSVPMRLGIEKTSYAAAFFVLLSVVVSPLPFLMGIFGWSYLLVASVACAYFLVVAGKGIFQKKEKMFKLQGKHMKLAQFVALLAFVAGTL